MSWISWAASPKPFSRSCSCSEKRLACCCLFVSLAKPHGWTSGFRLQLQFFFSFTWQYCGCFQIVVTKSPSASFCTNKQSEHHRKAE